MRQQSLGTKSVLATVREAHTAGRVVFTNSWDYISGFMDTLFVFLFNLTIIEQKLIGHDNLAVVWLVCDIEK